MFFQNIRTHVRHTPHILHYEFHKGVNTSAAGKSIQSPYGNDVVNERSYRR